MSAPEFSLLTKRRFAPIFAVQFLGAFNDNLLKFALLFLATFTLYKGDASKAGLLSVAASGIFIAPYFLFSALAGQIADARDKAMLVRFVKAAEIGIMGLGLAGFWFESVPALLVALFLMGMHSTLFGPVKYSIIPQHLHENEVVGGIDLFDRIEVWAIGRQEQELGPRCPDSLAHGLAFVAAEIVHDDDVSGRQGGHEELLDIGEKELAVDRPVEHTGRIDPVMAQRCYEGQCLPFAERGFGDELAAPPGPAPERGHVGLGPGLVDEDQFTRIKPPLILLPLSPPPRDLRTVLLAGEQAFF